MNNNKRSLPSKQAEQSLESARGSCDVLKAAELHSESEQNIEVPRYARQQAVRVSVSPEQTVQSAAGSVHAQERTVSRPELSAGESQCPCLSHMSR